MLSLKGQFTPKLKNAHFPSYLKLWNFVHNVDIKILNQHLDAAAFLCWFNYLPPKKQCQPSLPSHYFCCMERYIMMLHLRRSNTVIMHINLPCASPTVFHIISGCVRLHISASQGAPQNATGSHSCLWPPNTMTPPSECLTHNCTELLLVVYINWSMSNNFNMIIVQ